LPRKTWIADAKLRALFNAGVEYDEIARLNEISEGWLPTRSTVKRKLERMGMPPRRKSHRDLIPWTLRPEHSDDRFRHMLQVESRSRAGCEQSDTDRKLISMLQRVLNANGKPLVVGYHPETGFFLANRTADDTDIIRRPKTPGDKQA
jgi:hypothetical protein